MVYVPATDLYIPLENIPRPSWGGGGGGGGKGLTQGFDFLVMWLLTVITAVSIGASQRDNLLHI